MASGEDMVSVSRRSAAVFLTAAAFSGLGTEAAMQVVWGRYDASFIAEGAHGFGRDNPNCETHILDASHFLLDEKPDEVHALHLEFLSKWAT